MNKVATANETTMFNSTDDLEDSHCLRDRMADEGYLYLPHLIAADRAMAVKRDIMALLRAYHIIEDGDANEPMWSGGPEPTEAEWMTVYDRIVQLDSFQQLARSPEIVSVVEAVCGKPAQVWEQQLIRVIYPDLGMDASRGFGVHQDGDPNLGYQASQFYTAWVSLMDLDTTVGGLAVSPGSHKLGLLEGAGTVASSRKDVHIKAYGLDPSKLSWSTAEFEPGGTVIFSCRTAHRGMSNHSDRIRLSCDFRYQPASDTSSWLAHTSGPEVRRVAQAIDETIAGRALYITARPTSGMLGEIRRRMLEEKDPSLARAQALVREITERDTT